MATKPSSEAIVKWADRQKSDTPANSPKYKRVTQEQCLAMLNLHKLGKSQVEIAQTLNLSQPTVSNWLARFQDMTGPATEYLRGSALRMAQNVVKRGQARDHIQALNGLGVLNQPLTAGISVTINGLTLAGTGHTETVDATFAPEGQILSEDMHRLSADTGSDK